MTYTVFQEVSKPLVARFAPRSVLILFVLCLLLGEAAVVWRAKARADAGRVHARTAAQAQGTAVELQLSQALTAAEVLGALARQSGGGISNFQTVALQLLASRPGLACLELQPGGVVSDIVPRAGHERAIGFNVLKDAAHRPGACAAMQMRVLTVTGPLILDHGEQGIVVRVPVFQRGRDGRESFWGFVAVSMLLSKALARAGVDELWKQGYSYAFFAPASTQQKAVTIATRGALSLQDAVQQPVRTQNLEFRLALRPQGGWINATMLALESLGVLAFSGLLCLAANLLERRRLASETAEPRETPKDRSSATDSAAGAQAEFALAKMQERLEGAVRQVSEVNELTQTKLKQAESSACELQARLDTTVRAAEESARAKQDQLDQARLGLARAQQAINEMQGRLEAAASAESNTTAATLARLQQEQATVADLKAGMEATKRSAKEAAEASAAKISQAEEGNRELTGRLLAMETRVTELSALLDAAQGDLKRLQSDSPGSAGVRAAVPIGPVPSEPKQISGGESMISPVELSVASSSEMSGAKRKSTRRAKREQVRRDDQIDLFEGQIEAGQTLDNPVPNALAIASAEETRLPALEFAPTRAASAPQELEDPDGGPVNQLTAQPQSEPQAMGDALGDHSTGKAALLDLPLIEELAATDDLAQADEHPRLHVAALQHFVEHHANAPEKIREALRQGDLSAAERMMESLRTSAGDIGASAVQSAATALVHAVNEPSDPVETESRWEELERVVRDLVADLKPVLKPKDGKPVAARRMPAPPRVNPAQLRKAANEILPLLADQDPGAKDCLKANRATFRSAFTAEAYEEFERCVKMSSSGTALEQLKKAAKKQGISL